MPRLPLANAPLTRDARTTPPAARPLVVGGLVTLSVYMVLCFRLALGGYGGFERPAVLAPLAPILWVGRWRMFTELRTTHTDLDVALLRDGGWQPQDMAALYPVGWDEGPGYTRDPFLGDPDRVAALAAELCGRTNAQAVRLTRVVFDKTPGSAEQPRVNPREHPLLEQACGG